MDTLETHANVMPGSHSNSETQRLLRAFMCHRMAKMGLLGLSLIVLAALLGPLVVTYDVDAPDLSAIYAAPSISHLVGTDQLGRDLLARLLEGAQISLSVALTATLIATLLGCFYGLLAGMGPLWLDRIMMQVLDAILAIPVLLLVIVSQAFGESSMLKVIAVIGLASWMGTARLMRTECRRLMETEFVSAAIVGGASYFRLALVHVVPNVTAPLLVVVTVGVGQAVLIESTLSFINLGVPSTLPSWGNLLGNGMSSMLSGAWWVVVFPGLMIMLTVLSINLVGDGLRDIVDPKRRTGV
jgi:peptide/nickel transport system permease protein